MAWTQASRQRLYRELGDLLSQEAVDELMDAIPPVGWGDVARRQDLTNLEHSLRAEMAELRGEVRTEFAAVRTEMAGLESSLTAALRLQLFSMLGAMFTLAGLTWAATSLA
jgi:hypothetical protein